jgi:hypothetical protein
MSSSTRTCVVTSRACAISAITLRTYVHLMDDGLGDADFLDRPVTVTERVASA